MDKNRDYFTLGELARLLRISRIAVYKKVKNGQIKAVRIGRIWAVPKASVLSVLGKTLDEGAKQDIDAAVKRVIAEYGETLKLLGRE